jgi:ribosomal protein L11
VARVKNTPRVTGFVGGGTTPGAAERRRDQFKMLYRQATAAERPRPKMTFEKNETVRIIDGPFANFQGKVDEINPERNTLRVLVTIFGRATPVELDFLQVEKTLEGYGKENYRFSKVADSGRQGHAGAAGGHRARSAGRQHHGVLQGVQRQDVGKDQEGLIIPVVITIFSDRSFTFITKTPPVPVLIKRAVNLPRARPSRTRPRSARSPLKQVEEIAKIKMPDLNCFDVEAAMSRSWYRRQTRMSLSTAIAAI